MERILFSKYSNERAPQFAIRTDITEENGRRWVRKQACYPEGRAHIAHLYQAYLKLDREFQGTRLSLNRCIEQEHSVKLEYLRGRTLQEVLDGLLKNGDIEGFKDTLRQYIDIIRGSAKQKFVQTPEFRQVFGEIEEAESFVSAEITDIDMVLGNVFVHEDGQWTLIDYEWTFDFPVPIRYVIYRVLHYYEYSNAFRNQIAHWDLYRMADITQKEKAVFREMEINFQNYVLGNYVPLRHLYPEISPGKTELSVMLSQIEAPEQMQVFVTNDGIFREEDSRSFVFQKGIVKAALKLDSRVTKIRLDPGEKMGRVVLKKLEWDSGEACVTETNGIRQSETDILFVQEDPQIYIEQMPPGDKTLHLEILKETDIKGFAAELQKTRAELMHKRQEAVRLAGELQEKERIISAMENTKVWKMYKKYKTTVKGVRD